MRWYGLIASRADLPIGTGHESRRDVGG